MSQPSKPSPTQQRRCLYDILDIARSANSDEIKVAYKKQAKRWHPDRNINNAEEATLHFKEINEAYEILSDKHERAWYDAHRDAILRGIDKHEIHKQMEENEEYDPDIDLMPYFNPFIFTSFEDNDENSFYNLYNEAFARIIDLEKLSKKKTPTFGGSKLSYHKMKSFYSFWEVFESRRSFQFATKYNLSEASNRRIRKLMHKENRKLIETKRKKWEETILKLVAFIKKRDPRFRNYLIESERTRIEHEEKMAQYQAELDEIMKEEHKKQREKELEEYLAHDINNEEVIEIHEELYECVVCNKIFKSENAFKSHESSKKHQKALENLKFQLLVENEVIFDGKNDCKMSEQNKLDSMIAKQIAHQENVENMDSDKSNEANKAIDVDYLMALAVEQEDIINAAELFDDDAIVNEVNDGNEDKDITDGEILILLQQPGIDIDALLNTYPSLTRQYILDLKGKNGQNDGGKKTGKKYKKKKKQNINEDKDINEEDEEANVEQFMSTFQKFNKKSDFINKQKQKHKIYAANVENEGPHLKEKKRRRRRKNKNSQNNQFAKKGNVSPQQTNCGSIKSKCKACNQIFGSKSKLYNHLKSYPKHALKTQHMNS